MRLHETIENENAAKRQFIADIEKKKKRFAQLENENRQLRSRTGRAAAEPRFNYVPFEVSLANKYRELRTL